MLRSRFSRALACVAAVVTLAAPATGEARTTAQAMEGLASAVADGMATAGLGSDRVEVRACTRDEECHVRSTEEAPLWIATARVDEGGVKISLNDENAHDEGNGFERSFECEGCGDDEWLDMTHRVAAEMAVDAVGGVPKPATTAALLAAGVVDLISRRARAGELDDLRTAVASQREGQARSSLSGPKRVGPRVAMTPDATMGEAQRRQRWTRIGAGTLGTGAATLGAGVALIAADEDLLLPPCAGMTARARARCPEAWASRSLGTAMAVGGAIVSGLGIATLTGRKHLARVTNLGRIEASLVLAPKMVGLNARF